MNNILVVTLPEALLKPQASAGKKHSLSVPKPLEKYASSTTENVGAKVFIGGQASYALPLSPSYVSVDVMNEQINEMQVSLKLRITGNWCSALLVLYFFFLSI